VVNQFDEQTEMRRLQDELMQIHLLYATWIQKGTEDAKTEIRKALPAAVTQAEKKTFNSRVLYEVQQAPLPEIFVSQMDLNFIISNLVTTRGRRKLAMKSWLWS